MNNLIPYDIVTEAINKMRQTHPDSRFVDTLLCILESDICEAVYNHESEMSRESQGDDYAGS